MSFIQPRLHQLLKVLITDRTTFPSRPILAKRQSLLFAAGAINNNCVHTLLGSTTTRRARRKAKRRSNYIEAVLEPFSEYFSTRQKMCDFHSSDAVKVAAMRAPVDV